MTDRAPVITTAPTTPTPLTSASEVTLFRDCQRKWAWTYVAGLRGPQSSAQALGDDVDEGQLQPYLKTGRPFDYTRESGYIAAAGLAYLPPPMTAGLEVQKHFNLPSASSVAGKPAPFGYQGYLDLWLPQRGIAEISVPCTSNGITIPIVADFKTTSDLKWAKTEGQLAKNVQAQLYATWAMYETGARVVDLVWIYFQTRGPKRTKRTHLRVLAPDVAEQFQAIDRDAQSLMALKTAAGVKPGATLDPMNEYALSLSPNPDMCESYGGCAFRHKCNLSPGQIADSMAAKAAANSKKEIVTMNTASLFANLTKKRAETAPAAPAAATPAPTAASAPSPAPSVMGCSDRDVPAPPPNAVPAFVVNPPESALPPVASTTPPATSAPTTEKATRKRTSKKDATEPDAFAAAASEGATGDEGDTITVTWAEERYSPVQYQSFGVGPFTLTGKVRAGETRGDALRRLSNELFAFAVEERANKSASFLRALGADK